MSTAIGLLPQQQTGADPEIGDYCTFCTKWPGPTAVLEGWPPQRPAGAGPETGDCCLFCTLRPDSMSTAIGICDFPQKVAGGCSSSRLLFHDPPSMKYAVLDGPRIPRSGVEPVPEDGDCWWIRGWGTWPGTPGCVYPAGTRPGTVHPRVHRPYSMAARPARWPADRPPHGQAS